MKRKFEQVKIEIKRGKFSIDVTYFLLFISAFIFGNFYIFSLYSVSIILHECVHLFVAKKLGYSLDKFKLSISGASMKLQEENFFLNDEIIIALSAPLFNLGVFIILASAWWIYPYSYNFTYDFALVNLFIFLLNMLPVYSFDGGRVLVCLFEKWKGRTAGIKIVKIIGVCLSLLLFLLFLLSFICGFNLSLGVMSILLFISCTNSGSGSYRKLTSISKLDRLSGKLGMEEKVYVFSSSVRLINLYRRVDAKTYSRFILKTNKGDSYILNEDDLFLALSRFGAGEKASVLLSYLA